MEKLTIKTDTHKKAFKELPSLKELAACTFADTFDPNNTKHSLDQLHLLRKKARLLPQELQEHVKTTIVKEKAEIFEQINNAKPLRLSDKEIYCDSNFKISPNSEYLCYITQKRLPNNEPQWPVDTLALIHLPSGKENRIVHPQISCGDTEIGHICTYFTFSDDSSHIFFHDILTKSNLFTYDIAKKEIAGCNKIPQKIENYVVTNNKKRLINSPFVKPILDPTQNYYISHQPAENTITINTIEGTPLFTLPHVTSNTGGTEKTLAQFSPSGQQIATVQDKTIALWNFTTRQLFHSLHYHDKVEQFSFADENTLLVGISKKNRVINLLRNRINSRTWSLIAYNIGKFNHETQLSADSLLYAGPHNSENCLVHCLKQTCLKTYPAEPAWVYHTIIPDGSAIIIKGFYLLDTRYYPYLYYTHRAITNHASLDQLLALFIAERQKKNGMKVDSELINTMGNSESRRLQEIARQRYAVCKMSFLQKLFS